MAKQYGDFDAGATIFGKFTTVAAANSIATSLANGNLIVFKDGGNANYIDGVTLTLDFGGKVGYNHFAVNTAANATLYANGSFFDVMLSNGNVGGSSVSGYSVGGFTLRADSALKPTVGGRTANLATGGQIGVNWADIANPGSTQSLTATTISPNQNVFNVTGCITGNVGGNINGNLNGSVLGNMNGSVGSVAGNVNGNVIGNVGGNLNGNAGIDWARVANPGASNVLSGTTISTTQVVANIGNTASVRVIAMDTGVIGSGTTAAGELNNFADALLDRAGAIEAGITPRLALRYIASAVAGNLTGGNTALTSITGVGVGTLRIAANTQADGNTRTVTLS